MAYERYEWDPDEKQLQTNQPLDLSALTSGLGLSQAPATLPQSAGGVPGSRFVGFDRYLSANQEGAKSMADSLAGGIEKKGKTAQDAIATAEGQFQKGITSAQSTGFTPGTVMPSRNPANGYETTTVAGQGGTGTKARAPAVSAPGAITRDELERRVTTPYAGPTSLYDQPGYEAAAKATAEAQKAGTLAGTPEGRQALLSEQYGKGGNYSEGMNRFDAALVGAGNGARFGELGKRFGAMGTQLTDAATRAQAAGGAARGAYNASTGQYQGQLDDLRKQEAEEADRIKQEAATKQAEADRFKKRESFGDYRTNRAADYGRGVLGMDPVGMFFNAAGETSPGDWLMNAADKILPGDQQSNRTREFKEGDEDVYNSMTQEELAYLERLRTPQKQREWIEARRKQLRGG